MKRLRWLMLVPLLGIDECPPDQTYLLIEVEGALNDEECVNSSFERDSVPLHVWFSCAVDPTDPVDTPEPEVRCHPSGDIGLRISPSCTLSEKGAVKVDVKFDLLYDDCTQETGSIEPVSIEVPPGGDGWGISKGGTRDDYPECYIFGPPVDGTNWLLVNVLNGTPEG